MKKKISFDVKNITKLHSKIVVLDAELGKICLMLRNFCDGSNGGVITVLGPVEGQYN